MMSQGLRTTIKKINGDTLTPITIFKKLPGHNKFLLESASLQDGAGRYSLIGANPRKSYVGRNEQIIETELATGKTYTHEGDLFTLLKRLMPRISNNSNIPFFGGAVGFISSNATLLQPNIEDELALPDAYFHVYDTVIVYDHLVDEVMIVHTNIDPEVQEPNLEELAAILLNGDVATEQGFSLSPFESALSKDAYTELLEQAKDKLQQGDGAQIVLSRRLQASFAGSTFDVYRKLRKHEAAPYMSYVECGDYVFISTSPAGLVKVTGDQIQANPVAGTIVRGENEQEDVEREHALVHDVYQTKRHYTLLEQYKQDFHKIAIQHSVQVVASLRPARFSSVIHLVSQVTGTLLPMLHSLDALAACLPATAVVGAPKQQAAIQINALENVHRSFYGAAIGYIGFNGNIDFALAVRTLLIYKQTAYIQVGTTVQADSDVGVQFEETERKIASLLRLSEENVPEV